MADYIYDADLILQFQEYANSKKFGYLKNWKANGIIHELKTLPSIMEDHDRFNKYLRNCLEMEGFNSVDILDIQAWLAENVN